MIKSTYFASHIHRHKLHINLMIRQNQSGCTKLCSTTFSLWHRVIASTTLEVYIFANRADLFTGKLLLNSPKLCTFIHASSAIIVSQMQEQPAIQIKKNIAPNINTDCSVGVGCTE